MFRSTFLALATIAGFVLSPRPQARADDAGPRNLALTAHASAFESYQGMTPDLAANGKMETRWSGIPGHNTGGWYELDWDQPVRIEEVVIFQYDRFVKEMDLQVWDEAARGWHTLQHLGRPDSRLPKVVVCQVKPAATRRLRLANITNGPSFTEVAVFEKAFAHPPAVNLASDADGRFIGMVSDAWGSSPVAGAAVALAAQARSGPWTTNAQSDNFGLFFVPMPLGLTGQVTATMRLNGSAEPSGPALQFDAAGFQYGLTPDDLHRRKISLAGQWRFAPDPPADFWKPEFDDQGWTNLDVPSHWVMQGFQSVEGVGGYRKRFRTPASPGRLKLRFDGVYSGAEVWVNGRRLAYHEGGALPFEVDLTEAVRPRDNLLAVRVTEHTVVSDQLDKMSQYADFPLAGIFRPVYLFQVPPVHIGALALTTTFDSDGPDATIAARVAVLNESTQALSQAALQFRLIDPEGRATPVAVQSPVVQVEPWHRAEVELSLPVAAPRHWEAEHPTRYTLETQLKTRDRTLEVVSQKIGFRQTQARDGQLLINGQPVKIRGTCHHDSQPLRGRAVTGDLERQDLELMKEANLNSLRTSHYPPLPALLDSADELGLYVEDEGSFCWAAGADDLRLTPRLMQLNAELLARDRNHPSVFLWSVCNESDFGYGLERSHHWLRAADPSRPNAGSYDRGPLEILARHNPITLAGIAAAERMNKPVLWDEAWCLFQGVFGDVAELWLDPGVRDYYVEPLPGIYGRMMQAKNIAGTQIWAWSDDIFCVPHRGLEYGRQTTRSHFIENQYRLPGRGLVGDAPWGIVDGWRRKKPEFWIIKKLHSPVKLHDAPLPLPAAGEPIRVALTNEYDFTDLGELELSWQLGAEHGKTHTPLGPHRTGELTLQPDRAPAAGQVLGLEFRDRLGRLVDAYQLPFGEAVSQMPELRSPGGAPLLIRRENYLAGEGTRVIGGPPGAPASPPASEPGAPASSPAGQGTNATGRGELGAPASPPASPPASRGTRVIGEGFELAFDQASGGLRRGVAFGQALLLELPRIHLLPAATPLSPLPNPLSWRLQSLEIQEEGADVRIKLKGSYDRFEGGYDLLVSPAGALTVSAAFKYSGPPLLVREVGLAFSVPKDCDLLRWQRQAEWSVYPQDHIGRPLGETRAFAPHAEELPPTWPWAADNSPMGCNDFRSTKRHIDWASISYPNGPGVWVQSNGSQHLRATVESDRISVHVNDWYGGTHAGLGEWTSNYGEGKRVASGETIDATIRLRLAAPATPSRSGPEKPAPPDASEPHP